MEKLPTLALPLAVLAVFTGLAAGQGAQHKDKNSPPAGVVTKEPAAGEKKFDKVDKAPPKRMTGRLTRVNKNGKPFTEASAQWPQVVSLPPCKPGKVVTANLSTGTTNGVKNPLGGTDPKWHLTQMLGSTGLWPAYSFASWPLVPWMILNSPQAANWIGRPKPFGPLYIPPGAAGGDYRYRVRFNLNPTLYSSIQIVGKYGSDDLSIVSLNGVGSWATSCSNSCFVAWQPFSIAATSPNFAPFISGVNDLEGLVDNNQGTITGLIVDAKLQATCKNFDLAIQKGAVNTPWQVGGQGTFNIVVQNLGPDAISQGTIAMEDLLPLGFEPPFTITQPGSLWNCSTIPVGLQNKLTCTWPANTQTVAVGPLPLITITGTVKSLPLENCAKVTLTHSPIPESNLANNNSCIKVEPGCDLEIKKSVTPITAASGHPVTIMLTVTNVGTAPCPPGAGTIVHDSKPAGLTLTAPPVANQPGWACSLAIPTGDADCANQSPLPPGYSVTFTINAMVTALFGSSITNCATITNANDTNPANNKSCVTVKVKKKISHP